MPRAPVIHVKGGPENFVHSGAGRRRSAYPDPSYRGEFCGYLSSLWHAAPSGRRGSANHSRQRGSGERCGSWSRRSRIQGGRQNRHKPTAHWRICEERLYPVEKLIKTPDDLGLTDQELASVLIKRLTAQFPLHETYQVKPGETVLIHAAAVGMGHTLCPLGQSSRCNRDRHRQHGRKNAQGDGVWLSSHHQRLNRGL
jgi:hypothetical protein